MKLIVTPGNPLIGAVNMPGDKSLSHRAVLFAAMAEGESRIENFLVSGVTRVMLIALSALGVSWTLEKDVLTVQGKGLAGWTSPQAPIDCGNSATTIRLLAGAITAAGIPAVLDGSAGLRRRPMDRIVEPLRQMGVRIDASPEGTAPLVLHGRPALTSLHGIDMTLPVASAQVKTCLLLAALAANGPSILREPGPSRDHTERMLSSMGVQVNSRIVEKGSIYETSIIPPKTALKPIHLSLPGDISAAAFLIVAAAITPSSQVRINNVGLNPTRTGLIDVLQEMGAKIRVEHVVDQAGEPAGDLEIQASQIRGVRVGGPVVVRMIDEFSAFGTAAAYASGATTVQDAVELRFKESDRIGTLCNELRSLGIDAVEAEDGFTIKGGKILGGQVQPHGDHRLAMAMAIAGLASEYPVIIEGAEIIQESFPEFTQVLRSLGANITESVSERV